MLKIWEALVNYRDTNGIDEQLCYLYHKVQFDAG
jgi:hypothetical protein